MNKAIVRWLFGAVALAALETATATPAAAELVTGSELVVYYMETPSYVHEGTKYGPYDWEGSYERSFDGEKLKKHMELDFEFLPNVTWNDAQKQAYKERVEAEIERVWNRKFVLKDRDTGLTYPITVDVTIDGPYDQSIDVDFRTVGNIYNEDGTLHPDNPTPTTMNHWHTDETGSVMAHEFGHMLGLCDEYLPGAVDQYPDPTLSDDGLMGLGANLENPVMYPRYYQQYLDYMYQLNPTGRFALVAVPEPGGMLLALVGAAGVAGVAAARRRRRAA